MELKKEGSGSRPGSAHSSVFGPRPPARLSHSLWKSQPSNRWRYVVRMSRYSGASSDSRPGKRTGVSFRSSCSRGPRWQSYRTKSRLAAYGTMRLVRKLLPVTEKDRSVHNHNSKVILNYKLLRTVWYSSCWQMAQEKLIICLPRSC